MKIKMTNLSIYEWEQEKQAKEAGTWSETEADPFTEMKARMMIDVI